MGHMEHIGGMVMAGHMINAMRSLGHSFFLSIIPGGKSKGHFLLVHTKVKTVIK